MRMVKRCFLVLIALLFAVSLVGCGGSSSEEEAEWLDQLKTERQQAENLYASDETPEEKAEQASQKMLELENQYTAIMDDSGKEADDPLIRGFIDVREMYVAIKNNDQEDYFSANAEIDQVLEELE